MKRFALILSLIMLVANICFANIKVTMLNVGQGDSFLIQTENKNILIDTSDVDERKKLVAELAKARVFVINKMILTHAHADHIGNAAYVIQNYGVEEVYDNGSPGASKYAANYLKLIKDDHLKYKTLKRGEELELDEGVKFEVVHPANVSGFSVNNQSVVGRLVYGKFAMIFTGDAENEALLNILYSGADLKAQVLKAGHHGSRTSALLNFVQAVKPEWVVISAGEPTTKRGGNTYGHPHADALATFKYAGIPVEQILWSWKNGTVVIESDGEDYNVTMEESSDWYSEYMLGKSATVTTARRL